jgi:hypothetical protein
VSGSSFDNRLLAALPQEVYGRLCSALDPVAFALGDVVYDTGARLAHIYFPTTCVVSLIYTMEDGATAEMGLVGEGAVDCPIHGRRDNPKPSRGAGRRRRVADEGAGAAGGVPARRIVSARTVAL